MQKHVEIQSGGLTLRGYIHIPSSIDSLALIDEIKDNSISKKVPLAIMLHGFTANKMEDHFYYVRLSRQLEKAGIASLRFDFGNSGESDGEFENMTPTGEIQDALNIIDYAKTIPYVDTSRITLVGFSMGGMIAAMTAAERKDDIEKLCLISPAANLEDIFKQYFQDDKKKKNNNKYQIADIGGLLFSEKAYEDMKKINPIEKARGFNKKVMIIQGTLDEAVPVEVSKRYKEIYGQAAEFFYVEGANHIFSKRSWEESVRNKAVEFIKK